MGTGEHPFLCVIISAPFVRPVIQKHTHTHTPRGNGMLENLLLSDWEAEKGRMETRKASRRLGSLSFAFQLHQSPRGQRCHTLDSLITRTCCGSRNPLADCGCPSTDGICCPGLGQPAFIPLLSQIPGRVTSEEETGSCFWGFRLSRPLPSPGAPG